MTPRSFDDKLRVILIIPKCMNQTEQKHVFEHILKIVVWLTVILVPVFFLPITLNILDFNKQFLLYGLVTVGVLMWFISAMARRTLIIHKTALDIPLIILLAVVGLSTLFSLDRQESFENILGIVYKKDGKGNFASDSDGRKILDHDLEEIAEAFREFAKKQKFSFCKYV